MKKGEGLDSADLYTIMSWPNRNLWGRGTDKLEAEAAILTPAEKLFGEPSGRPRPALTRPLGHQCTENREQQDSLPKGRSASTHGPEEREPIPFTHLPQDKCPKNFVFIIKPCSTNLKSKQTGNKPHEVFPLKGGVQSSANKLNVKL